MINNDLRDIGVLPIAFVIFNIPKFLEMMRNSGEIVRRKFAVKYVYIYIYL